MPIVLMLVYLVDALGYTATKAALLYVHPIMGMVLRMTIAGTALLVWVAWHYSQQIVAARGSFWRHRSLWLQAVGIHMYLTYITYFISMSRMPSSKVALFYNLSPFAIALLGYFLIDQRMTHKKWLGLVIGFVGILPIIVSDITLDFFLLSWAEVCILISVIAGAYGWFVVHHLMYAGYSPLLINGISMLGAGLLALPTSLLLEGSLQARWVGLLNLVSLPDSGGIPGIVPLIGYTVLAIGAVNIVFYNAITFFLRYYSIVFISFIGMLTPAMVAFLSWFLLNEPLPHYFILSFTMLGTGFFLFAQEELRRIWNKK